jgi:hypothetical protein
MENCDDTLDAENKFLKGKLRKEYHCITMEEESFEAD